MKRALVLALGLASCAFAQKHPAITAGIVAGTIGFVSCAPAVEKTTTCLMIGAGAGIAIGGITGLVTTFADTSAHALPADDEQPFVREPKAEPAPVLVDAGVADALSETSAPPADAGTFDAASL